MYEYFITLCKINIVKNKQQAHGDPNQDPYLKDPEPFWYSMIGEMICSVITDVVPFPRQQDSTKTVHFVLHFYCC